MLEREKEGAREGEREKEAGSAGSLNMKTGLINSVDFTQEIDSKGSEFQAITHTAEYNLWTIHLETSANLYPFSAKHILDTSKFKCLTFSENVSGIMIRYLSSHVLSVKIET